MAGRSLRVVVMTQLARRYRASLTGVIHLAAQAGVRHTLKKPFDYVQANLVGHMVMLEVCRHELPGLRHLVYASSSSVYGGNTKIPFSVEDPVDRPVSLYAATKRADELMSHCYSHLYRMPQTGLRFFTVYGPWGRPDMAAYLFADAILTTDTRRKTAAVQFKIGRTRVTLAGVSALWAGCAFSGRVAWSTSCGR